MITAKSYRSQVKRGISSPSANSLLIYINDRHFSRIMQDTQLTTHTAPPNAAPYASQRISENNIQQQRTRIIVSHLSTASRYLPYLDSTVITRPQIKLWQIQENKSAFLEKRILFPDHHERKKSEGTKYSSITGLATYIDNKHLTRLMLYTQSYSHRNPRH